MAMTIHEITEASPAQLAALPAEDLMHLQQQADEKAASIARVTTILHAALAARYGAGLNATGTHHREDAGVAVTVTVPKKVKWDQSKLTTAVETIRGWGEDPSDYVDTEIKISERRYVAWPPSIRTVFEPARTVDTGKPVIRLAAIEPSA